MAILRSKRKEFKAYAKEHLDDALRLRLEYDYDYPKLNTEGMVEDFLNTISLIVLLNLEIEMLFNKFVNLYSKKYMYYRFLQN